MKTAFFVLPLIALTASPTISAKDKEAETPRLTVELRDGSRIVGTSLEKKLKFRSDFLGDLAIPVGEIRSVEFTAAGSAKLVGARGDVLLVALADSELEVGTSFGKVELAAGSIRRFTVRVATVGGVGLPGLVARWAGEGGGEDSVGDRNLELAGVTFAPGQVGQAFDLNGSGASMRVREGEIDLTRSDGLTLSAWINPRDVTGFHPIFEWNLMGRAAGFIGVQFWIGNLPGSQGVLAAHFVDPSGKPHSLVSPPGTIVAGRFQQISATYDKGSGQGVLYVNGVPVVRERWERFEPLTKGEFWIGTRPTDRPGDWSYNTFFSGLLDEVSIYDRALSPAEIADVCAEENNGEPLPAPSLTAPSPPMPIRERVSLQSGLGIHRVDE